MSTKTTRLIHLRKKLGLTQTKLGALIGKTGAYLSKVEMGDTPVTPNIINSMVEKFNANREWLENGEGEMFMATKQDTSTPTWAEELIKKIDKLMENQAKLIEISMTQTGKALDLLGKKPGNYQTGMHISHRASA